jgi:hypothetical protein
MRWNVIPLWHLKLKNTYRKQDVCMRAHARVCVCVCVCVYEFITEKCSWYRKTKLQIQKSAQEKQVCSQNPSDAHIFHMQSNDMWCKAGQHSNEISILWAWMREKLQSQPTNINAGTNDDWYKPCAADVHIQNSV